MPAVRVLPCRQSALADGVVRFAGEPVVAVVATDPYRATAAAGAVLTECPVRAELLVRLLHQS